MLAAELAVDSPTRGARACVRCGKRLRSDNRSGYCRAHTKRGGHGNGKCACGAQLGRVNHSGKCRRCNCVDTGRAFGGAAGESNPQWNGGRIVDSKGYVRVKRREHPRANVRGYVMEHILVVEQAIRRALSPAEVVHHVNRVRADNRVENLVVFETKSAHSLHHKTGSTTGIVWRGAEPTEAARA